MMMRSQAEDRPQRLERRDWTLDACVALVVLLLQVAGTYRVATHRGQAFTVADGLLLGVGAVSLVARRQCPVVVLAVTNATTLAYFAEAKVDGFAWLSVVIAFGTAIYLRRRIAALVFLVACYVGALWLPDLVGHQHAPTALFALSLGVGLAFMIATFEAFRLRQQRSIAQAHGKEEETLRRATEEKMRMARELHDVVAHNISVINVQANSALHLMERQPERARSALQTINDVSKQALVELRSVLGVLRAVDEDLPRAPVPGLSHLGELLEGARAAGFTVAVEEIGDRKALPAEVDLAAYRIVQEALTNTVRHSKGRKAVVRISYGEQEFVVEVDDDGARRGSSNSNESGSGILGMSERAAALGGYLEAGPRDDNGFRVRACIPIHPESLT